MSEYKCAPLGENVEEMFIGPFGSSLKNECFVDEAEAYCMVYEQKHAIQKTMDVETRYVNEQKYNELKRFNVHGGDIIVSCRGTIGETFVVPDDAPLGIMHPSIMKIRLKDGVYNKYYFNLLLRSRLKKHEAEANGSGIKMAISATELGKELFPVPSIDEQQEITDIISKISDVIDMRKQELAALDELIKARFVELFDGWKDKYNAEVLGAFLDDITYGFTNPMPDAEEGPWKITAKDVVNGIVNLKSARKTLQESFDELTAKSKPQVGDVLLTKDGTLGRTAVVEVDGICVNQSVAVLRTNDRVLPKYLSILLQMPKYQGDMMADSGGGTIKHIYITKVVKMPIVVPSIEEQEEFLAFAKQVDKSKVVVQKSLEETQLLFASLMQKYFG